MKLGIAMFPTAYSISPTDLAVACEERGFDSIWFPEHSHFPASSRSNWPGGDDLPKWYFDVMDPFLALTAAAMEDLKSGDMDRRVSATEAKGTRPPEDEP